ncbi:EutN/CcmL family microcompartment protein [Cetobacterium sp.]|uniref:EutN/CcmL family microcompartment protein n=1 Tax=Cetobacterium sp. TaxID=2071632 RepID=UPI0025C45ED7|nr:EutN/CcmL family microcompartment protein [Cetobacterium sp.]
MFLAKVVGKIVSTTKHEALNGKKILIISPIDSNEELEEKQIVSLDGVGAGIGDQVLVCSGSTAQYVFGEKLPIDSVIVSIIDTIEKS